MEAGCFADYGLFTRNDGSPARPFRLNFALPLLVQLFQHGIVGLLEQRDPLVELEK